MSAAGPPTGRVEVVVRIRGGLAGLAPVAILAVLFVASDRSVALIEQLTKIAPVGVIAILAGVMAAPVAASPRRRLLAGALAFAIVVLAEMAALSVAQGIGDAITSGGFDVIAMVRAAAARASIALISTAYLAVPIVALGFAWSVAAHGLGYGSRVVDVT